MHPTERKQNLQRLQRELKALQQDPVPGVHAAPLPANMLEWHYVIEGPAGSPYQGGFYHGIIRFPQEYPFKPPSIRMLTPSGRFEPNQRICLSMSDFHPETWNCMWSVSSILQGVASFMLDAAPAIGTMTSSEAVKRQLARQSMRANLQDKNFRELFPDLVESWEAANPNRADEPLPPASAPPSSRESSLSTAVLPLVVMLLVVIGGLVALLSLQPQANPPDL
mmetsp:Transcript_14891/g.35343  ORF Transcript_14891/g.35343 Transcript_14891/m.35343 type:complete len:223 (+) Transcript_14891:359-1027(+)|eukprot:CAMPEP_0177708428 /NCGR_PEP_ID=MMETSP0484_2-20121128/10276_1 /TAXON_ID=354590 /ORGANISM="Rhodomonas lens, Strain RHODO" /LENGTH=222 /DNA_ID=CAMNT_0019220001 /DNA_START=409 /DNA_END=1077 /DNA_ORIENTATION=-